MKKAMAADIDGADGDAKKAKKGEGEACLLVALLSLQCTAPSSSYCF